jgi:hypothetical protein
MQWLIEEDQVCWGVTKHCQESTHCSSEGIESDSTLWAKGWSQALHRDRRGRVRLYTMGQRAESDSTMVEGKNHTLQYIVSQGTKYDLHTLADRAKSDSEL